MMVARSVGSWFVPWEVVWHWEGNNADGLIAANGGVVLFANNDASNVMRLDPATGRASIAHDKINTGGRPVAQERRAVPRVPGTQPGILQRKPQRKVFASSYRGEPFECVWSTGSDRCGIGLESVPCRWRTGP